ncbi:maltokinase N-terminal cap-like domain-containing protein [Actinocorallia longicatena]|uniref:Maltokinase n=1 Tax=Actinocorallia longicatena TaxID=111803 RepID=A0ABP6Q056_9ACTN
MTTSLEAWLPRQRWFAGKGRPITSVTVRRSTPLADGLTHQLIEVRQDDETSLYQHLDGDGFPAFLLSACAAGADLGGLRFRSLEPLDPGLPARPLGAEQSNTSFVYGRSAIGKVFRLLTPGLNPDLELTRALTGRGQVARLHGWFETDIDGVTTTLGMVSEFLADGVDGWKLATATGNFRAHAHALGAATARVHKDLAAVFGVARIPAPAVQALARTMTTRLDAACSEVPRLAPHRARIAEAFADLASHGPMPAQRIHGDYHLGQVMSTPDGWRLLDFEGEPSKPLEERRAPAHPLRDVAGMLRSFDYAAHFGHTPSWSDPHRSAFCSGYAEAGGPDPSVHPVPLRAFVYDKAVYEVVYEARNRPHWLPIPLSTFE